MKPPLQRIEEFLENMWDDSAFGISHLNVLKLEAALKEAVDVVDAVSVYDEGAEKVLKNIADILDGGGE